MLLLLFVAHEKLLNLKTKEPLKLKNLKHWNSYWTILVVFFFFFFGMNGNISRDLTTVKSHWEISWNAEIGDYRFWLCFEIPSLRQLAFRKRVQLLAKWDHTMNITIWVAWSRALLTHTHAQKNDKVSSTVHLAPVWPGTTAWTHHRTCKLTADPHRPSQN